MLYSYPSQNEFVNSSSIIKLKCSYVWWGLIVVSCDCKLGCTLLVKLLAYSVFEEDSTLCGIPSGSKPAFGCLPALESSLKQFFNTFFIEFSCKVTKKHRKSTKKVENGPKTKYQTAFWCTQHPKTGQITQHLFLKA